MPKPILIICPSRNRPAGIDQAILSHQATTSGHADFMVAIDEDQAGLYPRHPGILYDIRPRKRMVPRFNEAAMAYVDQYEHIAFIGDDHRFRTLGWEDLVLTEASRLNGWSLIYGDDKLKGEELATAAILSSKVLKAWGHVCPPIFQHMCMDTCWMDVGRAAGILSYLPGVVIEHMHFSVGKSEKDAGYESLYPVVQPDIDAYYAWVKAGGVDSEVAKVLGARS